MWGLQELWLAACVFSHKFLMLVESSSANHLLTAETMNTVTAWNKPIFSFIL